MTDDPPALHGTLPLARDPGGPVGVRLVPPGEALLDPVRDASGLPEAALTLRAFATEAERAGYAAALAETGGNTFTWTPGPVLRNAPPLLLVARWDRPRAQGHALDEAVAYVGPASAAAYAGLRDRASADSARDAAEARVRAMWKPVTDAASAYGHVVASDVAEGGVRLVSMRSGAQISVEREADGFRVSFRPRGLFSSPADEGWRASVEGLGLRVLPSGMAGLPPGPAGAGMFERVDELAGPLAAAEQRRADRERASVALDEALSDRAVMRALADLCAGFVVIQRAAGGPAQQLSPRVREPRRFSGALLARLYRNGLAVPAWMPPEGRAWAAWPGFYAASAAGRALVSGDREGALALMPDLREVRMAWNPKPREGQPTPDAALGAVGAALDPDARERLAALAPPAGAGLPRSPESGSWPGIAAGLVAGTLALEAGPEGSPSLADANPDPAFPGP